MDGVYVEICVFKPAGYSMSFFVENCENRWYAILQAVEKFNELNGRAIECVNYVQAKPISSDAINPSWIKIPSVVLGSEPTVQKE